MKTIIYDFGANNGDDVAYYLLKADLVVAVDANPVLCDAIRHRFPEAIADGRLVVENCVLATADSASEVPFYVHKSNDLLSQFPKPHKRQLKNFTETTIKPLRPEALVRKHGDPHYVKIDLENYDADVLRALFESNVFPPYLSAECHSPDVLLLLIRCGRYDAFKLIEGLTIAADHVDWPITTLDGDKRRLSFSEHASGPFGDDLAGEWRSGAALLNSIELGWRDVHAKRDAPRTSSSWALKTGICKLLLIKAWLNLQALSIDLFNDFLDFLRLIKRTLKPSR